MIRTIVEKRSDEIVVDVYSRLIQERIICIDSEIDAELASGVTAQLIYLDSLNNEEIIIRINSNGGSVYDGLSIIDTMRLVKSPVKTIISGKAFSMAAIIGLYGDERVATKYSTIMLHQPLWGFWGGFKDSEIEFKEFERMKNVLLEIVKEKTFIKDPEIFLDRDVFMTPGQAKELHIIDQII